MRRSTVIVAMVAALALPAGSAAAKRHGRVITIEATSKIENARFVDTGPTGDSPGDMLVFTEKLFDAKGVQIGSDAATCVRLFDVTSLCTGTYRLQGGRLMVQLLQPGPTGAYDQAITGGTGRFAGARGTVAVNQQPTGDRFTFKIRVDRVRYRKRR
jgi:hypothetical protein